VKTRPLGGPLKDRVGKKKKDGVDGRTNITFRICKSPAKVHVLPATEKRGQGTAVDNERSGLKSLGKKKRGEDINSAWEGEKGGKDRRSSQAKNKNRWNRIPPTRS